MKVIGRLPQASDFWEKMQENHWVWLHDARGAEIPPEALPNALAGLGDDPYRALAGYAEDENAFDKDRQSYFIEFHWARYFGERMHWRPISRATPVSYTHLIATHVSGSLLMTLLGLFSMNWMLGK